MTPDLAALHALEARHEAAIARILTCPATTTVELGRLPVRTSDGTTLPHTREPIRCTLRTGHPGPHEGYNLIQPWTWR